MIDRRTFARASLVAVSAALLLLAAGAFSRTGRGGAIAQGLLRLVHGGCPFGYDQTPSPAQRELARAKFAITHRDRRRAAARPALGFTLDRSTRRQVIEQMAAWGVHCENGRGWSDLTCFHVPSAALPGAVSAAAERSLWFTFGTRDQLLTVIAISRDVNPVAIADAFASAQNTLSRQAGGATTVTGSADSQTLARGLLSQASAEFRFHDYYALERVANMGTSYVLTEEYRSLPD